MNLYFRCIFVAQMAVSVLASPHHTCKNLSSQEQEAITQYIRRSEHLLSTTELTIEDRGATAGCYEEVIVQSTTPRHPYAIRAFVSSDRRFIVPSVHELKADVIQERRWRAELATKELMSDSPPVLGAQNPSVSVVVFGDFECPFCKLAFKRLRDEVLPLGSIGVAFRQLPLPNHAWAIDAGEVTACLPSKEPQVIEDIYGRLYESQESIRPETARDQILEVMSANGKVDVQQVKTCVASGEGKRRLLRDQNLAMLYGASVTPTVFVNGQLYKGLPDVTVFKSLLPNDTVTGQYPKKKGEAPVR